MIIRIGGNCGDEIPTDLSSKMLDGVKGIIRRTVGRYI